MSKPEFRLDEIGKVGMTGSLPNLLYGLTIWAFFSSSEIFVFFSISALNLMKAKSQ